MEMKTLTPEDFMEALENLAKAKKEKKLETPIEQSDCDSETPYVVRIAFENGGLTTVKVSYKTMVELLKAIEAKKESFIVSDAYNDPFFIACDKVLAVLTDKDDD